ncbi:MAG TPA: tRNA pseudouridine(55) synthase TruB [Blastocatellia bacterium]|nr:tRNA pseudouridine(55) synthase TruB [Blastocatellia bacterium]
MNGALIIDKPPSMTSHDVVARVRRAVGTRRAGHAGTLDPFATGVLVVCVGNATRLVQFLVGLDKQYRARLRLGYATDTQDLTGKRATPVVSSHGLSEDEIRKALTDFTGPQAQVPPMYSAKKVGGERLYRAAREGRQVARQPLPIFIHSLELEGEPGAAIERLDDGTIEFVIDVSCSSGTYIRTLAHDVGERLGPGGHLIALRRMRVGRFDISQAVTLEEVFEAAEETRLESLLVRPADVVGHLHSMSLDLSEIESIRHGREIEAASGRVQVTDGGGGPIRMLDESGGLVAVGELDRARSVIRPRVVLTTGGES